MPQLGPAEILVVFVVALLVFGPNRLPEVGKQVGRAMREIRRLQSGVRDEIRDALDLDGEQEARRRALGAAPLPAAVAQDVVDDAVGDVDPAVDGPEGESRTPGGGSVDGEPPAFPAR